MKCDLQNKNEECDKSYEAAIKQNPKIPGLQASYASHLYRRGDAAGAEEHYRAEIERHPLSERAISVVMKVKPDTSAKSAANAQPQGGR